VQAQAAESTNHMAAARLYAQSALEIGMHWLCADPYWRADFPHDQWLNEEPIGEGTYTWKLVDEINGDLTSDTAAPVRLYGKGVCGEAVRVYSVLVQPESATALPANLIDNGDLESGLTPWIAMGVCDLEWDNSQAHAGTACLWVKNRVDYLAGPRQDITAEVTDGATYSVSIWAKTKDSSEQVWVGLWVRTEYGWRSFDAALATVGGTWTEVAGTFTPSWPGTLQEAYFKVETTWSNQEFRIDDAVMIEKQNADSAPSLRFVRGSMRREVGPW
ncbi:MAG: carbohydrate binding domain-containing protein, partial [Phycisphaerales bacterium]